MRKQKSEPAVVAQKPGNGTRPDPLERRAGRGQNSAKGNAPRTESRTSVSTRLSRIAELSRKHPESAHTTLAHHIDEEFLKEAWRRTRKDGAAGADGATAADYAANLDANLRELLGRFKLGTYRAPPVRRVHIPKANGKTRPIGIPAFEDKVLQRAVTMVLEAVYEPEFIEGSYGFRPGRSAHDALEAIRQCLRGGHGGWVIEADIESFFDRLDHGHLREFLGKRVKDGVIVRAIGKWLNAGVLEAGQLFYPETGSPQGGVISPMLANIYLHEVLDVWFTREVQPRLRGRAELVRYADDFVIMFQLQEDAERVMEVLPKRFGKYGLTLHPAKTRIVDFKGPKGHEVDETRRSTFDFLGFTHYWGKSLRNTWMVRRKTARDRLSRTIGRVWEWCKANRHLPLRVQHRSLVLKLHGHYGYFGVNGNERALRGLREATRRAWRYWLNHRGGKRRMTWPRYTALLAYFPLPYPRLVRSTVRDGD